MSKFPHIGCLISNWIEFFGSDFLFTFNRPIKTKSADKKKLLEEEENRLKQAKEAERARKEAEKNERARKEAEEAERARQEAEEAGKFNFGCSHKCGKC